MEEDIKGKFITRDKGKGIKYKLYVPENVNADTPIFVYAYGSGEPNLEKCVSEHGSDSIIIGTLIDYKADMGTITMDLVNEVKQEFGVTSTNVSPSGFSLGGPVGYQIAAENIRRNPDCEPQTVFLIDAYGTYFYNPQIHLNDTETMDLFKENQTIFFAFDHSDKTTDINTLYAKSGLNLITVKCIGQDHGKINTSFFSNGLYNYRADEKLPKDGYIYSIYNEKTGNWEEIPYEKIATLDDIYSLFGIENNKTIEHKYTLQEMANLENLAVTSNSGVLEESLNKIRSAIRNSNIVNGGSIGGCSSTTMMPGQVGVIVSRFLESTTSCLSKIVNETTQFAAIGESIEELNFNLERKAMEINEIEIAEAIYGEVPSDIENDVKKEYLTLDSLQQSDNKKVEEKVEVQTNKDMVNNIHSNNEVQSNKDNNDNVVNNINGGVFIVPPSGSSTTTNNSVDNKNSVIDKNKFINYDNLISNDDQLVYEYDKGCKLVIYKDGNTIVGMEHYYDLNICNMSVLDIKKKYIDNEYFSELIQKDNYVKVILKSSIYENKTINTIKNILDSNKDYKLV